MEEQILHVLPSIGKFKISIRKIPDFYDRSKINDITIRVGGKDDCVNITIPMNTKKTTAKLSMVESIGKSCTNNGAVIRGPATIEMLNLAFTIVIEIAPHITAIELDDMSRIPCITPTGQAMVSLSAMYIAMYGKTWYQDKFGAVLKDEDHWKEYKRLLKNRDDPEAKPAEFRFNNEYLEGILPPLYAESRTWAEFFEKIKTNYPADRRCAILQPWLHNALLIIFKGNTVFQGATWIISLKQFKPLRYYQIRDETGAGGALAPGAEEAAAGGAEPDYLRFLGIKRGGGEKRKKSYKRTRKFYKQEDYIPISTMLSWDFYKFLKIRRPKN